MSRNGVLVSSVIAISMMLPALAQAEVFGEVGLNVGSLQFDNSDDGYNNKNMTQFMVDGLVGMTMGANGLAFVDASWGSRNLPGGAGYDTYAPSKIGAVGLHAGARFSSLYVGGFVGMNRFQGDDASSANGTVQGNLFGLEVQQDYNQGTSVFAQIGRASLTGDGSDTAFKGNFAKLGVGHDFGRFSVALAGEYGKSPDVYEDSGDWGVYKGFTLSGDYEINDRFTATASISSMKYIANTEDDGQETIVSLGIKMPFGNTAAPKYLRTPYTPGLAAAWGETLD